MQTILVCSESLTRCTFVRSFHSSDSDEALHRDVKSRQRNLSVNLLTAKRHFVGNNLDTSWLYVQCFGVRARSARISIISFFMFLLCHSNYKNIAHSYRKKITQKSTLECTLDYDEYLTRASRSNTGTQGFTTEVRGWKSRLFTASQEFRAGRSSLMSRLKTFELGPR